MFLTLYVEEDDLVDIMGEVLSMKTVYYPLGQSLRLRTYYLKAIREAYPSESDAEQALEDVLLLWLHQKYNVKKFGPPTCLLYTSPSPRDATLSRMPSSA